MLGQGTTRKKMKADPSIAGGGGERQENEVGGAADNLRENAQHPLLIELVMDALFKNFSLLNHDDSSKTTLAELRPVCQTWNQEIGKKIRKETQINVEKLISPYPEGLGWTATTTKGEHQDVLSFKYAAPMPEGIGTFENVAVTIKTCTDLQNASILKWFQVMGSSVESLYLTCSFNCYHQNRFVEKILKEWCPNLESLTLQGVFYCKCLIENSYFGQPSLINQCKLLKQFILCFDGLKDIGRMDICGLKIEFLETPDDHSFHKVADRQGLFDARSKFVKDLANYVHKAGEPGTSNTQETGLLKSQVKLKLVRSQLASRPIGLSSLDGMTPRTFGPHAADFFQDKFSCDPGYEHDGGIIAQLMKMSKVEKFVIKKVNAAHVWFFNELFPMFFFRPNSWRSTLQHLECLGHCPVVITFSNVYSKVPAKNIFSKVGFPLKRLRLVGGFTAYQEYLEQNCMERILSGCAETLEELEFGWVADEYCWPVMSLPVLPKLKVLVVQNEGYPVVKVTSQDIMRKFSKLERCVIKLERRHKEGTAVIVNFFKDEFGDGSWVDGGRHPLKQLKLLDENVDGRDIERMVASFLNLKIVELSILKWSGECFKAFWEKAGELGLEQVKISFSVRSKKAYELCAKAMDDNIEGFKELQWLELVHEAQHPFPLTSRFSKVFAKVAKLRMLKFTNFQLEGNMAEEIKKSIPDVVVRFS